jgi:hypothetical protein
LRAFELLFSASSFLLGLLEFLTDITDVLDRFVAFSG